MASPEPKIRISELREGDYESSKGNAMLPASVDNDETFKFPLDAPEKAAAAYTDGEVAKEKQRAEGAEQQLRNDLNAETSRAKGVEQQLRSDLNSEASRAKGVEQQLLSDLNSEASRAMGAEQQLRNDLNTKQPLLNGEAMRLLRADGNPTGMATVIDDLTGDFAHIPAIGGATGYIVLFRNTEYAKKPILLTLTCDSVMIYQDEWFRMANYQKDIIPLMARVKALEDAAGATPP